MTVGLSLKPPFPSKKDSLHTSLVRLFEFSEVSGQWPRTVTCKASQSSQAPLLSLRWRAPLTFMPVVSPLCQWGVQRKSRLQGQRPRPKNWGRGWDVASERWWGTPSMAPSPQVQPAPWMPLQMGRHFRVVSIMWKNKLLDRSSKIKEF